jgi:DNA-binding CsgD family transcriptional regulator
MAKSSVGSGSAPHNSRRPELSALTQEVLVRLTDGQRVKEIASELGLTRDAVDGRVRRLYRIFRVKGVAHLVQAAVRGGWISHPAEEGDLLGR